MEVYGKSEQQASLFIAVVSAILPVRRAEADYARKQPVSYPNRQMAIDCVPALENVLSINQESVNLTHWA
jgi:transposase